MVIVATILIVEFITLCILILLQWKIKTSGKPKLNAIFERLVKENKIFIHYKDEFNKKIIGFDRKNKKLLLIDVNKHDKVATCVSMNEIDSCHAVHLKDESSKFSKKVFLEITRKENNEPIRFCFYDESYDDKKQKTCLLLKARHWYQRINFHVQYWWINPQEYVL